MYDYYVTTEVDTVLANFPADPSISMVQISLEGLPGKSAYQIAVDNGFVGTQAQWLASLGSGGSGGGGFTEDSTDPGTFIATGHVEDPADPGTYI